MAKASITKKYTLAATGILDVTDESVCIEAADTGEMVDLRDLLSDFPNKAVKISVAYDEDYE